jgi:tRNA pseudouridine32 synthase/23S rRNA pseudouridine746 synthase
LDEALVVVDKPSGLLSVPGIGPEKAFCAQSIIRDHFGDALIVHRLDMDTSGIMVIARTKFAQRSISKLFEQRQTSKTYIALVEGLVEQDFGTIDKAIAKYSLNRPLRHLDDEGQEAITEWQVIERDENANQTRLELSPKTGRSHQLRLHLQSIGHPILGDAFYGNPSNAQRLCLHASCLSFAHPVTLAEIEIRSPAPF